MSSILIVDDEPEITEAIKAVAELHGHHALIADIETCRFLTELTAGTLKPDLILLDILLSGKDGRTICRDLKAHPATRHIPIIMMSAYPRAALSAHQAGAEGFIAKPFKLKELLRLINRHLPSSPATSKDN